MNNIKQPVIIIVSIIVILCVISIVKIPEIKFLSEYRKVDILNDVRSNVPAKPVKTNSLPNTVKQNVTLNSQSFDSTLMLDYSTDSAYALHQFFNKLTNAKPQHKKVRIAYFGDSFIESDNITDELRRKLQTLYGGNGIGFLPIQSVVAAQYRNIKFLTKGSWVDFHFKYNPYKLPLGLAGHIFYTSGNATTEFTNKNQDLFNDIKLYTGIAKNATSKIYVVKDGKESFITTTNKAVVNETIINKNVPIKDLRLASTDINLPIYGISIESNDGVFIDNYSFRGNNSTLTNQISVNTMQAFNQYLHYDLIILHYGINAVEHDKQKFTWFEASMNRLIETIKKGFPNTPILLISTSDIAYRYSGIYSSETAIPYMVATQQKIAIKSKVAFWDLYHAMGGENSMVHWVEGDTVLAYKDYIHVNEKGAKKIAGLLYDKLLASKTFYELHTQN